MNKTTFNVAYATVENDLRTLSPFLSDYESMLTKSEKATMKAKFPEKGTVCRSNELVAIILCIPVSKVEKRLCNIYKKLEASSWGAAKAAAMEDMGIGRGIESVRLAG